MPLRDKVSSRLDHIPAARSYSPRRICIRSGRIRIDPRLERIRARTVPWTTGSSSPARPER